MYNPKFSITKKIANALLKMEATRQKIKDTRLNPRVLATLRESARLQATHYSTRIEGNRLSEEEVKGVIIDNKQFPERTRDEKEVLGYFAALEWIEKLAQKAEKFKEEDIQKIHGLVMGEGKKRVQPSPYRDDQNVIRESATRKIVYLPPEAKDVPTLMKALVNWINHEIQNETPPPLIAGIAHYQFATIHPYYDGNGRTARLLTTLLMHRLGYDLKGIYSLDEYYAENLSLYYKALTIGPSHNYYLGRHDADITSWLEFFCLGAQASFETIRSHVFKNTQKLTESMDPLFASLDPKQKKVLSLFSKSNTITTKEVEKLLRIKSRTTRSLMKKWTEEGFLTITNLARKTREYTLSTKYFPLIR